jgi:ATP-dependent helicase HrpB
MNLPIDLLLPEILSSLEKHPNLIIEASPGSGKTTRVPPALLKSTFRQSQQEILILEPRRLAAKYSAQRIAAEIGSPVGSVVGYQFRFENVSSPQTRLKFVTEGMFMRLLMRNPKLDQVAAVILDEFHERHIHSDVALSYLHWLQKTHRPELRIIVMSATLESGPLSRYLSSKVEARFDMSSPANLNPNASEKSDLQYAPILTLQAALHPVAIHYLPSPLARHLDQAVREAIRKALEETSGDLLVFLPGMAEMRRCEQSLGELRQAKVLLLHGELSRDEQDEALRPGGSRKIILSTNVAETSLTIPGVTAVIDSGLHRMASYSWWSGIPALKTRPISRASAIQRAGRAGRTGPGICYRIYTKGEFETRSGFEKPELMRSDLSQTLLDLKALGVSVAAFPWFDPPPGPSLQASEDLLYRLGATEKGGALTELGRSMSRIAAHPRISRMLLEAKRLGVLESASWVGAALSEGRVESGNPLEVWASYSRDESLRKAQRILLQALQAPLGSLPSSSASSSSFSSLANPPPRAASSSVAPSPSQSDALGRSILSGFPDRVAQKRKLANSVTRSQAHEVELLLSSGGSAMMADTGAMSGEEFFILLDLQEQQNQTQKKSNLRVRSWIPIAEDWLLDVSPIGIEESDQCSWDAERKRVVSTARLTYGELVLSESPASSRDASEVTRVLAKNALGLDPATASYADWILALIPLCEDAEQATIESAFARAKIYTEYTKKTDREFWPNLLPRLAGKSSLADLKAMDWPADLLYALLGDDAHRVGELLPTHVNLAAGKRAKIHYTLSQPPWIESRLQDFFGMKKGPVLLNGRLPLSIHLLAPNRRPVQVTTDLESFWKNHYPQLRPALSRRYPRHSWPEIPS